VRIGAVPYTILFINLPNWDYRDYNSTMLSYTNEQITVLLTVQIEAALPGEDIKVFTITNPQDNEPALFLRINKPPISQYGGQTSTYGKSLWLLYSIQQYCNLVSFLRMYDVKHVAVTEALTSAQCNHSNTATFLTEHLKILFDILPTMTKSQCDEYIKQVIKLNNAAAQS